MQPQLCLNKINILRAISLVSIAATLVLVVVSIFLGNPIQQTMSDIGREHRVWFSFYNAVLGVAIISTIVLCTIRMKYNYTTFWVLFALSMIAFTVQAVVLGTHDNLAGDIHLRTAQLFGVLMSITGYLLLKFRERYFKTKKFYSNFLLVCLVVIAALVLLNGGRLTAIMQYFVLFTGFFPVIMITYVHKLVPSSA